MRSLNDQWDITSSVGATALAVAAARAVESERSDRLVHDPYAGAFVSATGDAITIPDDPWADPTWSAGITYQGIRSRYFDDTLSAAVDAGVTQVVLLAAGLDVRAYRLGWPSGVTVYEVDQTGVLDFKAEVLAERGATTGTGRVAVPVDLRQDWPAALRAAGFDPARPTAWLAEGLLPYLPEDAERLLFERVHALSAPGSRIAVEDFGGVVEAMAETPQVAEMWQTMIGMDVRDLFFDDARSGQAVSWLSTHGWSVSPAWVGELAGTHGRPMDDEMRNVFGRVELLSADLRG